MKKQNIRFLILTFLLLISSTSVSFSGGYMHPEFMADDVNLTDNFQMEFSQTWNDEEPTINNQTIPDITAIVDNIPDFISDNSSVFVGNEIPSKTFNIYQYKLNVTHISIIDDHDTGAGDIFLRGCVNHQIDDDMDYTLDWKFDLGSFNNGEEANLTLQLFDGWAYDLNFQIELYDDDIGIVDSFGIWNSTLNWTEGGFINVDYGGDATVQFNLEISGGPITANATSILDAYKPYLFSDVETSYDDPASFVFGRVIEGFDEFWGANTTCLQYIYYFPYEYTGTNTFVHYDDYEMILIYVDFSYSRFPYRLVWDNGFYFGTGTDTDWIDGQEYRIYELSTTPGDFTEEITFDPFLSPLLGESRLLNYKVFELADVYSSDMEQWGIFEYGMPTFQATIDTSYHQFDLGGPVGTDPMDMNRNYSISELNDTIIKSLYSSLNSSFSSGIHEIEGNFTPINAPFSWDITQPFSRPYIFNNYPKLCVDINSFNNAQGAKSKSITIDKNIEAILSIPCSLSLDLPNSTSLGEEITSDLIFHLDEDNTMLTLNMDIIINFDIDLGFWHKNMNFTIDQSIVFNFGTNTLEFIGNLINLEFNIEDFEFEDELFGDYVSVEGLIETNLLGSIANAEFSIYLTEMLKFLIGPEYELLIDILFDDIALTINPNLSGYLSMDVFAGSNQIINDVQFNSVDQTIPITFSMPNSGESNLVLKIEDIKYGVNFGVDWGLSIDWGLIPGIFLDTYSVTILTWPDIDIDLIEGSNSNANLATYTLSENQYLLTSGIGDYTYSIPPENNPNNDNGTISSFPISIIIIEIFGISSIIIKKKRK